jgi:hypothetical protein
VVHSMRFAAVLVAAVLGATGLCRADEQAPVVISQGEDVGAPSRPLRAVLSDFVGNQSVGSVVWHTDSVALPGQPPTLAVRADIEIPDLGMAVRLELRRNEDETLAASHTVELVFTLPSDFSHGEIANVPGIAMKAGETMRGDALKSVSVKAADNFFLIGLSSVEADRRRNIELIRERSWVDVAIAYSTGKRADILVEKAPLSERALAVLGLPAVELTSGQSGESPAASPPPASVSAIPRAPTDHLLPGAVLKPWPLLSNDGIPAAFKLPSPAEQSDEIVRAMQSGGIVRPEPIRPKLNLLVLDRPTWAWPPGKFWWAVAPGSASVRRAWQGGWQASTSAQPVLPETIRVASTTVLAAPGATVPTWLRAMSTLTATDIAVPSWPRVRAPDLRIPMEPSHLARLEHLDHLVPPAKFVRWSDRLETVLPADEVNRRCQAAGAKRPAPGRAVRGCAHFAAGRCFVIRVNDPGVARHELAHCNGWKHPEP